MGWVALAIVAAASFGGLWLLGLRGTVATMTGAALLLGGTGYALQGSPGLAAAEPAQAAPEQLDVGSNALRDAMYGRFSADFGYVIAADAFARSGDRRIAARALIGGIAQIPNSYILWSELGSVLAAHDAGIVSPTAKFAFARAVALAPEHPAPYYMWGLAEVRAGEFAAARAHWRRALSLVPAALSYREEMRMRLALLERLLAPMKKGPRIASAAPIQIRKNLLRVVRGLGDGVACRRNVTADALDGVAGADHQRAADQKDAEKLTHDHLLWGWRTSRLTKTMRGRTLRS